MIKSNSYKALVYGRTRKPVHWVQIAEGKRIFIHRLLKRYDILMAKDIQYALKDPLGRTN